MMQIRLFGIRNCDTVRKARAWLDERGVAYEFHDFHVDGIPAGLLEQLCVEFGWERVLNRAGTTFRRLPDADKQSLDEAKALRLLRAQPSMIKRPILHIGRRWELGFAGDRYAALLRDA
jgi:arsenate reductase